MARSESHTRSVSTRATWAPVKISLPPKAPRDTSPEASVAQLKRMARSEGPVTLTVTSRGGGAWWFEVKARGRTWHVEGHDSFLEVMLDIYNGEGHDGARPKP